MKVKELKVGTIYTCILSSQDVLVINSERLKEEGSKETETVLAGKVCVIRDGAPMFSLIELHDGQLKQK